MNLTTASDLLGGKRRFDAVSVGGLNVRIQSLSELEKARVDAANIDYKRGRVAREAAVLSRARLIVACVVDDAGKRLFSDAQVEQVAKEMDSRVSDTIYRACVKHVGGESNEDFAELVGNSAGTTSDDLQSA